VTEQYQSEQAQPSSQESRLKRGVNVAKRIGTYTGEFVLLEAGVGVLFTAGGLASGLSPAEAAKQTGVLLGIGNGVIVGGNAASIAAIKGYEKVAKSFNHWKDERKLKETVAKPTNKIRDVFKSGK
jgi:hypothetical protein